uniref:Uncharacterized protein n=1 Tax=Oryza meridionalis TaxID=40149 RepID=A0A0E0EFB7_9ORYZ
MAGTARRRNATADVAVRRRRPRCDGGHGATAGCNGGRPETETTTMTSMRDPSMRPQRDGGMRRRRRRDARGTAAAGGGWTQRARGGRRADGRAAVAAGRAATGAAGCATGAEILHTA